MKALRFLPLAYVADVHGFVLFAPYLLLVMTAALAAHQWTKWRARRRQTTRVPAHVLIGLSEPSGRRGTRALDAELSALSPVAG